MRILLIIGTLFLTACTSTQGITVYSFTNSQIEAALDQQLPKLREEISLMGFPVQVEVTSLTVNIGPDNRDVVSLSVDSSAKINAFLLQYPVRLTLQIEGSPFYDSERKAIFLRNVKLLDSNINAGGFSGNLALLDGEVMQVINTFLAVNPVYKLDTSIPKVALLSKLPLTMKVVEGAIKLIPRF
ncbi:DUF1439 domain-containing protein [Brumicola pallidula]|jgi:hypothetical protein|uniref:Lipoprotein n=1 Tax=Brumicola pallidula DSM 14239 = ACAM 615 TaxID=1121922 RepID=K6ZHJ6_9ALTE|nr:DUF1439 domain-containing protein [Glaciecola pallidula]GAC28368.1 lipoprotein [Glaciecola pallidula DSM 14239 = ACAM 615]